MVKHDYMHNISEEIKQDCKFAVNMNCDKYNPLTTKKITIISSKIKKKKAIDHKSEPESQPTTKRPTIKIKHP